MSVATTATTQPPTLTTAPVISGSSAFGSTLSVNTGTWQGFPTPTPTYQWFVCTNQVLASASTLDSSCTQIAASTATTRSLVDNSLIGKYVLARVVATNSVGTSTQFTASSAIITSAPVVTTNPLVSGTRANGETLTVSDGAWIASPSEMSTTHQWFRCSSAVATATSSLPSQCSAITDATSASYTQTPDDAGRFITARTTRTNSIGSTNLLSVAIAPSTSEPVSASAPVISGTAIYGSNLAVNEGSWKAFPSPRYMYQWFVCDNEVAQAGTTRPDGCVETSFTSGDMIAVDSGAAHTCAILADRTVQCWGLNSSGQLGNGTLVSSQIPVTVTGISNAVSISAGENHTCVALADGTARCWGRNASGQLGDNTITNRSTPILVAGLFPAATISAGTSHTCAALRDGAVWCWGLGSSGELGNGSASSSTVPVAVSGLNPVVSLSTGASHTCVVEVNGTGKCWGNNNNGRLGYGGMANSSSVPVTAISNASSVAAGGSHTCAVLTDRTMACWGNGSSAQLGIGTTNHRPAPVAVPSISNVSTVSAGALHTCATTSAGGVLCWGAGTAGQLGTGLANATSPTSISNLSSVVSVSAGSSHTCATRSSGNAVCWGSSSSGRLGSSGATGDSPEVRQVHAANAVSLADDRYLGKYLLAKVVADNGTSTPIFTRSTQAITLVPTYSAVPSVSGTRVNGATLSVSEGTWRASPAINETTYQWFSCIVPVPTALQFVPPSCTEISGATSSTYVQQRADYNKFLTVRTSRTNAVGTTNVWSTSMAVTNQSPNLSSEPSISGTAANGQTLTVTNGSWQGFTSTPTFAYQWFVCNNAIASESSDLDASCSPTSGASATLSLTNTQVGKHLLARVTASNNVGSTIRFTRSTAAVTSMPVVTSNPVISGTRVAGNSLSVSSGTWVGFPSPTSSHQWFKCTSQVAVVVSIAPSQCVAIDGATSGTYLQLQQDAGSFLTVRTSLVNELGTTNVWSASSEATGQPPTMISEPTLSGLASFGSLLSVIPGEWQGFPTPSISYQWFRCVNEVTLASSALAAGCTAISGATGSTYQAIDADLGKYLMPRVTSTNFLGSPVRFTNSTAIVTSAPNPLSDPVISGNRTTGQILTVSTPAILAFPAATSTHQWLRCSFTVALSNTLPTGCSQIDGATSSAYTLTTADEGRFVTAASTFTNSVGVKTVWSASAQMSYGRATFTSNSTWLVPAGVTSVDVLVVGGGGSGGSGSFSSYDCSSCAGGGGGGGGSVNFISGITFTPGQSISVAVGGAGVESRFDSNTALPGSIGGHSRTVQGGRHGGLGGSGYSSNNVAVQGSQNYTCDGALSRCGGAGGGTPTYSDITGEMLPYGGGGTGGSGGRSTLGVTGIGVFGAGGGGGSGRGSAFTSGLTGKPGIVIVRWITASN